MATDFKFTLDDLVNGSMTDAIQREHQKYGTNPLKTSFMANGPDFNTPDISTFSDLMQNIPVYDSSQDVLAKQNAAIGTFTQYLTATTAPSDLSSDSLIGTAFNKNLPEDLLSGAKTVAQQSNAGTGPGNGWVDNPTGGQQQDAQLAGAYVLKNPNVQFDNTSLGNQAQSEISSGQVSPNVLYVVNILSQKYAFKVAAAKDGNYPASALNYSGRAIEIDEVQDPTSKSWVRVGPNSQVIKDFVILINSITGPQRPTEVGCPWTASSLAGGGAAWPGFYNTPALINQYQDHIHIGNTDWGDVIPAAAGSTTTGQTSVTGSSVVAFAKSQLGVPYARGGTTPGKFLDCCITGDALIQMPLGIKRLSDIVIGDMVLSWDHGKLVDRRVIATQSLVQEVFNLRTRNRSIKASANHPFLRLTRKTFGQGVKVVYEPEWVRLDLLHKEDIIVTFDKIYRPKLILPYFMSDGFETDNDFWWLMGLFVGDGHISGGSGSICVYGEIRERAAEIVKNLYGVKVGYYPTLGMSFSNARFCDHIKELNLNKKSQFKQVPEIVGSLNESYIRSFIKGYLDSDGSESNKPDRYHRWEFKASSKLLIEEIRNIIITLGINVSNINLTKRTKPIIIKGKQVKNALPLHCFEAYPSSHRKQNELKKRKSIADILIDDQFSIEKVSSITLIGNEVTYDIEVEGSHNFIANEIVVHNSGLSETAYKAAGITLPRVAQDQFNAGPVLGSDDSLEPGDLVFFAAQNNTTTIGHVGIYIGNNQMIDAPHPGSVVRVDNFTPVVGAIWDNTPGSDARFYVGATRPGKG